MNKSVVILEQQRLRKKAKKLIYQIYPKASNHKLISSGMFSGVMYFELGNKPLVIKVLPSWFDIQGELFFFDAIQNLSFSPKIVHFDVNKRFYVMEYVSGDVEWSDLDFSIQCRLWENFGAMSRQIHNEYVPGAGFCTNGKFSNLSSLEFLISFILKLFHSGLLSNDLEISNDLPVIIKAITSEFSNEITVLLHGDLHPANSIHSSGKILTVIDPGPLRGGDPFLDIGRVYALCEHLPNGHLYLSFFSSGYGLKFSWSDPKIILSSLIWDLLVLDFLKSVDEIGYQNFLNKRRNRIQKKVDYLYSKYRTNNREERRSI